MSSNKMREALEKFCAIDLSRLKFPLDGDSSAIYNSDRKEITIPYWRVAMLLNEVNAAQDMVKSALAEPVRNCCMYETEDDAWEAFCKIHPDAKCPDEYWSEQYQIWLFAEAKGE